MNKTYIEMANETLNALVAKGLITVPFDKNMEWQERNRLVIRTVGWAWLELYREAKDLNEKIKRPPKSPKKPLPVHESLKDAQKSKK